METAEMEVEYRNHLDLLRKTVWDVIRLKRLPVGEFDELLSQSSLHFIAACQSYDSQRAKLSTWVRTQVWGRLMRDVDRERSRYTLRKAAEFKASKNLSVYDRLPILENINLLDELSEDSIELLTIISQGHLDLEELFYDCQSKQVRQEMLIQFLFDYGWTKTRIFKCFRELTNLSKPKE